MEWDSGFTSNSPECQQLVAEEDIEQFRSEKIELIRNAKSPEEIEKLSVDENLSPLDRAALLISTGQEIQKLCVIDQLPKLLKINQMDTLSRVIPKVCSLLPGANQELQETASKAFITIIEEELIPIHIYINTCLPSVLKQLESKDTTTSNLWLGTVLATIPHLPKEVIKKQILTIAEANGQLSMPVNSREGTCKLIGAMASKFDTFWVRKELCPLAKSLCLDVNSRVRVVMCEQLNLLIRALGLDIAQITLFPQLMELTNDEEPLVKSVAIDTLLDLVSFLEKATVIKEVVPIVKKFCENACSIGEGEAVIPVAKLIGKICHELKGYLSSEQRVWFMEFYCKIVRFSCSQKKLTDPDHSAEAECRRWCAYNLPAMVMFCGNGSFVKDLLPSIKTLAESPYISVRRTLACGLHEVTKVLGNPDRLKLAPVYQNLLKDSSGEVLFALINHLQESLEAFSNASNLSAETRQPGLLEFISPLLACEQQASTLRQWRLHQTLLSSMECLAHCMTSDQLYTKFIPVLFNYISATCVLPVKLAACRTLCVFIRYVRRQEWRQELCSKLYEECVQQSSFKQRLIYVDICEYILDIFSRSFFKEHFFQPVLELADDPIVNVRLHLCRLLPSLKSILKLPGDRVLLQKLEQTVRKLISQERDPDAARAIRDAVTEMDRIEVAMETLTRRTFFEADLTDQRKEEEEKALLLSEAKECEKPTKKLNMKGGKSPIENRKTSENRKGSSISLNTLPGGVSPSPAAKSSGKPPRATQSTVTKCQSAPSPTTSSTEVSSNPTNLAVSRKGPTLSSSPQSVSPSVAHKSKAGPGSKVTQSSVASTSSKMSANKSKDSVSGGAKSTPTRKSKTQQYGLEYAKTKKKT